MQQLIVSCDWGTSSFRLRLVNSRDKTVIGELITNEGVASTHKQWLSVDQQDHTSKEVFFFKQLKERIAGLVASVSIDTAVSTVIISGMASSSIGIVELPYASIPFPLDGSDLKYKYYEASAEFPYETWIISGLSSKEDVMRGEETQMIGIAGTFTDKDKEELICLFPGTHSKHIKVKDGCITGFETYMTGELYYLMTQYSVLRECVAIHSDIESLNNSCGEAFDRGITRSGETGLLNALFSTRINHLFERVEKKENAFYLSGLLIGSELRGLLKYKNKRIMLGSGMPMFIFYSRALKLLDLMGNTVLISAEVFDRATVQAHISLVENLYRKAG